MQLSDADLRVLGDYAMSAAKKAGALISQYANQTVRVEHKQGGDSIAAQVVTEVDRKSEAIIIDVLQPTCKQFDLALLTEETEDNQLRLEKDYFWCVDPMDGTLAFTESIPGYSVSIALVARSGQPVIGIVYDPVTRTLYSAIKGQGVLRNEKKWTAVETKNTSAPLLHVCDRGMLQQSYYDQLNTALTNMAIARGYSGLTTIEKNGAVLNACTVVEHAPAMYFKCPKPEQGGGSVWDFAATAAIFNEINAIATDASGQPLDLNRADSTYMNHRGVLFTNDASLQHAIQKIITRICLKK